MKKYTIGFKNSPIKVTRYETSGIAAYLVDEKGIDWETSIEAESFCEIADIGERFTEDDFFIDIEED